MKEWSKETFSKNLRGYMRQKNVNQKELAQIIGVSTSTFNGYYNGDVFPRIDKIQKLADFFGIVKSDLIEEKVVVTAKVKIKEKENSNISDVVMKMKVNKKYRELVIELQKCDDDQIDTILSMVKSFRKNRKN